MNLTEFKQEITNLNIKYEVNTLEKLTSYFNFLIEYNKHTNITRVINKEDVYLKHFYDSLTIVKEINLNNVNTLLDIGSGGGFPGVVLKIFFPHLKVDVLDSNNKKTTFLRKLINELNLSNINVIHDRAENYIKTKREYYDLVTFRAVSSTYITSELGLPYLKVGGNIILYKGSNLDEVKQGKSHITTLGGEITNINTFILPKDNINRSLINITKLKNTKKKYPRSYSTIIKSEKL